MDYSESSNISHERTPDPQLASLWRNSFHTLGCLGYVTGVFGIFLDELDLFENKLFHGSVMAVGMFFVVLFWSHGFRGFRVKIVVV